MAREDRFWSILTAGFAVWMFVLQSFAGALATGAGPQAAHDAFGSVLCLGDPSDPAGHPADGGDHRSCCGSGCMPGGLASIGPTGGSALSAPLAETGTGFTDAFGDRSSGSAHPGLERSRAPPRTA